LRKKAPNINVANFLSVSRIFSTIPLIFCLEKLSISSMYFNYSIVIIIYIFLSDILDGYYARKSNVVTDLGKIIDPVADKICLIVVLIYLIDSYHLTFLIFFILIVARDILLITYTVYLIIFHDYVSQANNAGKFFIFATTLLLISYIYSFNIIICQFLYIMSIFMLFISTYLYIKEHNKKIKEYEHI